MRRRLSLLALPLLLLAACGGGGSTTDGGPAACEGTGRCEAGTFFACVDGVEQQGEDCTALAAGATCTAGGCVAGCTEGELLCNGGAEGYPAECQSGLLVAIDTCSAAEHCEAGACVPDGCEPGAAFCQDGQPWQCDADGTAATQTDTCGAGERCEAGACVAGVCEAGAAFCQDGQPWQCDADGAAATQTDTCGADEACEAGACVPATVPSAPCAAITDAIVAATGPTITVAPAADGQVTVDGHTTTLRDVVMGAAAGTTILLEDGTYGFRESSGSNDYTGLYFTKPDVTLRSASGDPAGVILDSSYADHGGETAPITVAAPRITISGLTVKRSIFHLIHIWNGGDDVRIHDVRLIDGGEQFVKTSPGTGNRIHGGAVTCSTFLMTDTGRNNAWGYGPADGAARCYTGGIDTHDTDGWTVADNTFEGIYCDSTIPHPQHGKKRDGIEFPTYVGGLAEHAVHMWDGAAGTRHVIERNRIVNCARGIGLGLGSTLRVDGALVRNNMIFSEHAASAEHDVGIMLEGARNVRVLNNTVFFSSPQAYPNAVEYRFDTTTGGEIANTLTNRAVRQRNAGQADLATNVTTAEASWFVDAAQGDLHLAACDLPAVAGAGTPLADVVVDFDSEPRGSGAPDVGADQCSP